MFWLRKPDSTSSLNCLVIGTPGGAARAAANRRFGIPFYTTDPRDRHLFGRMAYLVEPFPVYWKRGDCEKRIKSNGTAIHSGRGLWPLEDWTCSGGYRDADGQAAKHDRTHQPQRGYATAA